MTPAQIWAMINQGTHAIAESLPGADVHPGPGLGAYNVPEYQEGPTGWRRMAAMGLLPPELIAYYEAIEAGALPGLTAQIAPGTLTTRDPRAALQAAAERARTKTEPASILPVVAVVAGGVTLLGLGGLVLFAASRRK